MVTLLSIGAMRFQFFWSSNACTINRHEGECYDIVLKIDLPQKFIEKYTYQPPYKIGSYHPVLTFFYQTLQTRS